MKVLKVLLRSLGTTDPGGVKDGAIVGFAPLGARFGGMEALDAPAAYSRTVGIAVVAGSTWSWLLIEERVSKDGKLKHASPPFLLPKAGGYF